MRKKAAALLITCILIIVVASLGLHAITLAGQSLNQNPSKTSNSSPAKNTDSVGPAEVSQKVIIEGNLTGPLVFIPEIAPPWSYELLTSGGTVGVSWNCPPGDRYDYGGERVRVYGVVKEGFMAYGNSLIWNGSNWWPPTVQYVEAERIELLP